MNRSSRNIFISLISPVCLFLILAAPVSAKDSKIKSPDLIKGTTKVDAEGVIEKAAAIPDLVIIDSRIKSDRQQGYIEGSVSLPDEMTNCKTLAGVIPSKNHPSLFYCNGPKCGRSAIAAKIAIKCGFKSIYWFRGGFEEWKQKKYPYIKQ